MIPLRDTIPSRRVPFVTWSLLAVNAVVFFWEISTGPELEQSIVGLAFSPARFFGHEPGAGMFERFLPLVSSMFLHGSWLHLLSNLLYLFIFGDNVEDTLGHLRFLGFYLACGAFAAVAQAVVTPLSTTPMVGASGAIAGVLGAYFVLFPHARVLAVVPIFVFLQFVEIPAFFFLLFWFVLQFAGGALMLGASEAAGGGIAWWAHVGGFAMGLAVAAALRVGRAGRRRRGR